MNLKPKLNAQPLVPGVPDVPIGELESWLTKQEAAVPNLATDLQAHIVWADATNPIQTDLCFFYVHGFSASWQETDPLTAQLAKAFNANIVQGRLAGHGVGPAGMLAKAEDWLESITNQFEIASRLGKKVVVVATSTGATLTTWLASQPEPASRMAACLFLSPNFRIRSRMGFLLTWPLSKHWSRWIVGKEHSWEPINAQQAHAWTHQYSTLALIEMQKVVDFAATVDFGDLHIPLAIMYMENDPTIYPPAAINVFNRWGARYKRLFRVELNGDAEEHVFVGNITNPERVDWCFERLRSFLQYRPEATNS